MQQVLDAAIKFSKCYPQLISVSILI